MVFKKHDQDKPPIHYLGQFYPALGEVASRLEAGHKKYGTNDNWKHCPNLNRYTDALGRHYLQYASGCREENHLAAIVCNALFLMMLDKTTLPQQDAHAVGNHAPHL